MKQISFHIKPAEHNRRLDLFLYQKMGNWSHKKIKQAIDRKRVFVNGRNISISGWNLKKGDEVIFCPVHTDLPYSPPLRRYHFIQVLFEDPYLLVTNKPPFVDYDSFVIQVNAYLKRRQGERFSPYLGQMHRLDKETSGILLFTKKKMANVLSDQFREHQIRKYYLALVAGRLSGDHGVIRTPLVKGKFEGGRKAQIASEGEGKESYTEYWVKERYEKATLLSLLLKTGRTHQIRVHLASIGHPVLGDKLYSYDLGTVVKRQMLHAHRIEFTHPVTLKKVRLEAPIPDDMVQVIDAFRTI